MVKTDRVFIIDSHIYQKLLSQNRVCDDVFYAAPDLEEDLGLAEDFNDFERGIKLETVSFANHPELLRQYRECLNDCYNFSSFRKVRGIADISIIALVGYTLEQPEKFLKFDMDQLEFDAPGLSKRSHNRVVEVFTRDRGLSKRLRRKFSQSISAGRLFIDGYAGIERRSYRAPPRHPNQQALISGNR